MKKAKRSAISQRSFLNQSAKAALNTSIAVGFPSIVPGKNTPGMGNTGYDREIIYYQSLELALNNKE
ncbi:MAG: hypothetical protein ABW019_15715 [Chitinophagaceae bacterium]